MADQPVVPSPSPDPVPVTPLEPTFTPAPESSGRRRFGRFDRRLLGLLAVVVVIVAILVAQLPQLLGNAPTGPTIWQRISAGITDTGVPKDTALQAFAYVFKVKIPGVTVPSGVDGKDAPTSGTGVTRWVQAHWSDLTPAQQAAIDPFLLPQAAKGTVKMSPTASRKEASGGLFDVRPPSSNVGPQPVDVPVGWPFIVNVAPDASPDLALAMADDISGIIVHLGPKLGLPVIYPNTRPAPDIMLTLSDTVSATALLNTFGLQYGAQFSPCNIVAYKNTWGDKALAPGTGVTPAMHVLLTHEVVHCYQNATIGNVYDALTMPSFITEGTAIYLAADDTKTAEPALPGTWTNYLDSKISLTNRSYDAIGYYSLLATKGRDLWATMAAAWRAAAQATPPQRADAFLAVLHGDDSDIRDNWAESYANAGAWGDPWLLHGFGAPANGKGTMDLIQAVAAPGWTGSLLSRANTLLYVQETSGEVVTVVTNGLASVRDSAGHSSIAFHEQSFCTVQSCVCPPGTALAGQDMASAQINVPFLIAVNAPEGGAEYHVIGSSLEELCKQKPTPAPTAGPNAPCSGGCPGSNGDPHMLTTNRYRYDFQAAGEFTLLRSTDGSLDIQARQEPYGQDGKVSINTAVAARVGSHKVGVYVAAEGGLQAHVDGAVVDLSAGPKNLGDGAQIARIDHGVEIDFPDGTVLYALSVGQWGINAQIRVSTSLASTGVGLLGKVTPGGLGVPNLPDGTWLKIAPDEATRNQILYGQFADAWRVTGTTSLFDYDSGKSTATYTIKPYPDPKKVVTLSGLSAAQKDAGNAACAAISDSGLHDDCVFDVAVSGDTGFAGSYETVQSFFDAGVATPTPAPATPSPSAAPVSPPPGKVNGAWQVTQGVAVAGFAVAPNDVVYANVQTGDNTFALMALDPAKQAVLAQVPVPVGTEVHVAAGSVWLPGLEADANGNVCSVTRFDGATLAKQATVAVPCGYFGKPEMASDGDAMWFVDVSKYDGTTKTGAVMTRLDPATNAPGTSVPLPFINGYRIDSQGAFFYYGTDPSQGYYRLVSGGTAFDQLGQLRSPVHAAGTGLWTGSQDGKTATYTTSAGTPAATVTIGGSVVAGDDKAVYVEVLGNNATTGNTEEQLWRYPADGSAPAQLASSPTIDGSFLSYFGDPMPIANGDGVLKFWSTRSGTNPLRLILLQWVPTK